MSNRTPIAKLLRAGFGTEVTVLNVAADREAGEQFLTEWATHDGSEPRGSIRRIGSGCYSSVCNCPHI